MSFTITKYNSDDKAQLMDFAKRVWPKGSIHLDEARWKWLFEENPLNPGGKPQIWLIKHGKRIVGQFAIIPVLLKINDQHHLAHWNIDVIIDPEFRRKGLASQISLFVNKEVDIVMGLGFNPISYELYKKVNWFVVGRLPHLLRVLDLDTVCKNKLKKNIFKSLCFFYSTFYRNYKTNRQPEHLQINSISNFDDNFDSMWERLKNNYKLIAKRDASFLNWRYSRYYRTEYKIFQVNRNSILTGYIILKSRDTNIGRVGIIVDMLAEESSLDSLIEEAVDYFTAQKTIRIDCFISDRRCRFALIRHGFLPWKSEVSLLVHGSKLTDNMKLIQDINNWYITTGDSDLDRE